MISGEQVAGFRRDGYAVVRSVFSADEVLKLREAVQNLAAQDVQDAGDGGQFLPYELSVYPELSELLLDDRLLDVAHRLLGDTPVYFRDSAVNIGGTVRGWHKDNRVDDRYNPSAPDWQGTYPIIRMGIYLQDHKTHSGGLALRVGSHSNPKSLRVSAAQAFWGLVSRFRKGSYVRALAGGMLTAGKPIHAPSKAGDVIVWNLRTTHTAHTLRLKALPTLKLPPAIENRIPESLALPEEKERIAVFATYGAPSPHLTRMLDHLQTRDYFAKRTAKPPSAEFLAGCEHRSDTIAFMDPAPVGSAAGD